MGGTVSCRIWGRLHDTGGVGTELTHKKMPWAYVRGAVWIWGSSGLFGFWYILF